MWIFSNKNSVNTTDIKQQLKICVWLKVMLVIVSVGMGRSERIGGWRGGGAGQGNDKIKGRTLSYLKIMA